MNQTTRLLLCALGASTAISAAASTRPGALDPTFGTGGLRTIPDTLPLLPSSADNPVAAQDADGRIYLVGNDDYAAATFSRPSISRLHPSGSIDLGYGDNGVFRPALPGFDVFFVHGVVLDTQGRLLIAGEVNGNAATEAAGVCRLTPEGTVDATFGMPATPGCFTLDIPTTTAVAQSILIQPCPDPQQCVDGTRIVVAGSITDEQNHERGFVLALRSDGSKADGTFGALSGATYLNESSEPKNNAFTSIAQNADGELVAAGYRNSGSNNGLDMIVLRMTPAGIPADSFGNGGYRPFPFDLGIAGQRNDAAETVRLLDDGHVIAAGWAQASPLGYRAAVIRVRPDGGGDPAFDGGDVDGAGRVSYSPCTEPCDMRASDLVVSGDGSIVLAGGMAEGMPDDDKTALRRKKNFFALRLLPDGTPDPSFSSSEQEPQDPQDDGLSIVDFGGVGTASEDVASSLLVQGQKLVLLGYATTVDPVGDDQIPDTFDFAAARLDNGHPVFSDGFEPMP